MSDFSNRKYLDVENVGDNSGASRSSLKYLLGDIDTSYIPLDAPQQQFLAEVISSAYRGKRFDVGDSFAYNHLETVDSPGNRRVFVSNTLGIKTIADDERVLVGSLYPQIVEHAKKASSSLVEFGDIVSDIVERTLAKVRTYDPSKSAFQSYANEFLAFAGMESRRSLGRAAEPKWTKTIREFLKDSSGGISLNAYVPAGEGLFVGPDRQLNPNLSMIKPAEFSYPKTETGLDFDHPIPVTSNLPGMSQVHMTADDFDRFEELFKKHIPSNLRGIIKTLKDTARDLVRPGGVGGDAMGEAHKLDDQRALGVTAEELVKTSMTAGRTNAIEGAMNDQFFGGKVAAKEYLWLHPENPVTKDPNIINALQDSLEHKSEAPWTTEDAFSWLRGEAKPKWQAETNNFVVPKTVQSPIYADNHVLPINSLFGGTGYSGTVPQETINDYVRYIRQRVEQGTNFGEMPELVYGTGSWLKGRKVLKELGDYNIVGWDKEVTVREPSDKDLLAEIESRFRSNQSATYQRDAAHLVDIKGGLPANFARGWLNDIKRINEEAFRKISAGWDEASRRAALLRRGEGALGPSVFTEKEVIAPFEEPPSDLLPEPPAAVEVAETTASLVVAAEVPAPVPDVGKDIRAAKQAEYDAAVAVLDEFPEYWEEHAGKGVSNTAAYEEWKASLSPEDLARFEEAHLLLRKENQELRKIGAPTSTSTLSRAMMKRGVKQWWESGEPELSPEPVIDGTARQSRKYNTQGNYSQPELFGTGPGNTGELTPQNVTPIPPSPQGAYDTTGTVNRASQASNPVIQQQAAQARIDEINSQVPEAPPDPWVAAVTATPASAHRMTGSVQANVQARAEILAQTMQDEARARYYEEANRITANSVQQGHLEGLGYKETDQRDNRPFFRKGNEITLDKGNLDTAATWAKSATLGAGDSMDDMTSTARERAMNLQERVSSAIGDFGKKFVEEMQKSNDPEVARNAQALGQKIMKAADDMAKPVVSTAAEAMGARSTPWDMSGRATYINNMEQLNKALQNNAFRERYTEKFGAGGEVSREQMEASLKGNRETLEAGDGGVYKLGQGAWGGGGRGGDSGRRKSIYQSDFGRAMMGEYMATRMWSMTGAKVMEDMDFFSKTEAAIAPLQAYGDGEVSLAASRQTRQEEAKYRRGEIAYEKFGAVTDAFSGMSGTKGGDALTSIAQTAGMAVGVGGAVGLTAWSLGMAGGASIPALGALGAAAVPLGAGVAAAIGVPLLAMDVGNAVMGVSAAEGVSPNNLVRGSIIGPSVQDVFGMKALNQMNTGAEIDAALAQMRGQGIDTQSILEERYGTNRSEAFYRKKAIQLEGGTEASKSIDSTLEKISEAYGGVFGGRSKIADPLGGIQRFIGSLDSGNNAKIAYEAVGRAADLGTDIASQTAGAQQIASYRGVRSGTSEAASIMAQYNTYSTAAQQEQAVSEAQLAYQNYAQLSPYLGGVGKAYQHYQGMTNQNPAGVQAAMSALSGQLMAGQDPNQVVGYDVTAGGRSAIPITVGGQLQSQMNALTPGQQLQALNAANVGMQAGGTDFAGMSASFAKLISSGTLSAPQVSALASFDPRAWSDLQHSGADMSSFAQAGISVPNLFDKNGYQAGERSMTDIFSFMANPVNGYANAGLMAGGGRGGLSAMGVYKGDSQMQDRILAEGTTGMQSLHAERMYGFQMASIGVGFAQVAAQENYLWGSKGGGTSANPTQGSMYGLQDTQRDIQWQSQLAGFAYTTQRMETSHQYAVENDNAAYSKWQQQTNFSRQMNMFDYSTNMMQRGNTRQQWQYQSQMADIGYGWQMEDFEEGIRTSTGRDRALLMQKRDRATLSHNLESSNTDKERVAQEKLWKREDERFALELNHNEKMIKIDEQAHKRAVEQREVLYAMDKADLERRIEEAKELHELQEESIKLQRKQQEESLNFQKMSLGIQAASATEAYNYATAQEKIGNIYKDMTVAWEKLSKSAPNILKMINSLANMKVNVEVNEIRKVIYINGGSGWNP